MQKNDKLFKHPISHIVPSTRIKLILWQLSFLKQQQQQNEILVSYTMYTFIYQVQLN